MISFTGALHPIMQSRTANGGDSGRDCGGRGSSAGASENAARNPHATFHIETTLASVSTAVNGGAGIGRRTALSRDKRHLECHSNLQVISRRSPINALIESQASPECLQFQGALKRQMVNLTLRLGDGGAPKGENSAPYENRLQAEGQQGWSGGKV